MASDDDELLVTTEVAPIVRKPVGTLRQWRHRNYGPPSFRLGGTVVYRRTAVEQWVREQEQREQQQREHKGAA